MRKFNIASRMVRERTSAARAAFIVSLTASAICLLELAAMYLGKLAAAVAACSAALQLVSRLSFALATASCAEADEI